MCFSATASFTAGVVLTGLGYASLKNTKDKSLFCLACLPLIFAFQQFAEGFVWLHLQNILSSVSVYHAAKAIYLIIAFGLWPIWIPFSLFICEKTPLKKWVIFLIFLSGIALSIKILLYFPPERLQATIVGRHIQYEHFDPNIGKTAYSFIIVISTLISSINHIWLFGLLVAIAYLASDYFVTQTFTSVWCFFSAIVSIIIYFIIKSNQKV